MANYVDTVQLFSSLLGGVTMDDILEKCVSEVISKRETEEEKLQKQRNKYNLGNPLKFTMDGFEEPQQVSTEEEDMWANFDI